MGKDKVPLSVPTEPRMGTGGHDRPSLTNGVGTMMSVAQQKQIPAPLFLMSVSGKPLRTHATSARQFAFEPNNPICARGQKRKSFHLASVKSASVMLSISHLSFSISDALFFLSRINYVHRVQSLIADST